LATSGWPPTTFHSFQSAIRHPPSAIHNRQVRHPSPATRNRIPQSRRHLPVFNPQSQILNG
jgi:hypothetical protein